jgi:hypothetical protein
MGRPKLLEARDQQLNIALTTREHAELLTRAVRAGMRPVDYARAQLLAPRRITASMAAMPPHLDPLFHAALSRVGNNINQIARQLNTHGHAPPPSLELLLGEIRTLLKGAR